MCPSTAAISGSYRHLRRDALVVTENVHYFPADCALVRLLVDVPGAASRPNGTTGGLRILSGYINNRENSTVMSRVFWVFTGGAVGISATAPRATRLFRGFRLTPMRAGNIQKGPGYNCFGARPICRSEKPLSAPAFSRYPRRPKGSGGRRGNRVTAEL